MIPGCAKRVFLTSSFWVFLILGCAAQSSPYLVRKHIDKDSTWIVDNSVCYLVANAGMKSNHFGWFQPGEMTTKNSDLLFFEANTFGSFQLIVEIKKGIPEIHFDTLRSKSYQLINHFYGNLRRDYESRNNTVDILSGDLFLTRADSDHYVINGKINIDTKGPVTHQQIVFHNSLLKINTIGEVQEIERMADLENKKQEELQWKITELVSTLRTNFYDSVFNLSRFPKNQIQASRKKAHSFDFTLSNSYALTNSRLSDSEKDDLMELLGGNIMATMQGNKTILLLHSFHDPYKNSIDDETNYSLSIQLDSVVANKRYDVANKASGCKALLSYWHYGPGGHVITSKRAEGTIELSVVNATTIEGALALSFKNTDKSEMKLTGVFQLPKLDMLSMLELERSIARKVEAFIAQQK